MQGGGGGQLRVSGRYYLIVLYVIILASTWEWIEGGPEVTSEDRLEVRQESDKR